MRKKATAVYRDVGLQYRMWVSNLELAPSFLETW